MERKEFEMSKEDLEKIIQASSSVPMIMLQCGTPKSQQANTNDAWEELGKKLGFDHMTAQAVSGKGDRFFTAVPI